ncbi:ABC transporter ATP-binding protein [Candidatus Gracilibacteria bacterium]|nr:ABC transporter ATP-binding protein [Candidatus Gracilibacteria bacterium]
MQLALIALVGSIQAIEGVFGFGTVVTFITYSNQLQVPVQQLGQIYNTILQAAAGAARVFAVLDEQSTVRDAPDAKELTLNGGHVVFDNVDFSYVKGRKILRNNTFEALPGQKIGLCGPTGAGKSTIMNILTRYYDVDSGTVSIDGQNIAGLRQASLRQQIGAVLQEAFLFSDTVMNNLKYARAGATDAECIAAAQEANAHEFIMQLPHGYDTLLSERGANLSQGQRQMLTIARAMVANPKLLILDEATSNVDTRTEKLIQQGLQRLMAGKTSFVIAHRLSTIRDSQRILAIKDGVILEQGTHEELMANKGLYYDLYMTQFRVRPEAAI